jgi:hypothetical protein
MKEADGMKSLIVLPATQRPITDFKVTAIRKTFWNFGVPDHLAHSLIPAST